jgi:hypothetical protein
MDSTVSKGCKRILERQKVLERMIWKILVHSIQNYLEYFGIKSGVIDEILLNLPFRPTQDSREC